MARHLYIHVPFCAHRCGYCDFVTTPAKPELHHRYVAALAREHGLRVGDTAEHDTVFVGGGTPTMLRDDAFDELLTFVEAVSTPESEVTVECNPETVTPRLAKRLAAGPVSRVSLGAQSFQPHVLEVLERHATPEVVRRAVGMLRDAGVANLNLDLLWGVPGQTLDDLDADLESVIELRSEHVSAYELEIKRGTRMARAFGSTAAAVGHASDDHYDRVIDAITAAGYEWYETANFCRPGFACRHNLAYWTLADHVGIGVGAVGTVGMERRTNLPNIARYLAAIERGEVPPFRMESIDEATRARERVMLALRLDRPFPLGVDEPGGVIDAGALSRMERLDLLAVDDGAVQLSRRGRMLLGDVLAQLLT